MPNKTRSPRRARRRARKTRQILDAAMAIMVDDGHDITMNRLADRLDVAVGGLYRYFPSKETILAELQRIILEGICQANARTRHLARQFAQEHGADPKTTSLLLILAVAGLFRVMPDHIPARFNLISRIMGDQRELLQGGESAIVAGATLPLLGEVAELFAEAARVGALTGGDPLDRTLIIWCALQGVLQMRKIVRFNPEKIRPKDLARDLPVTLLIGWGADRATLERAVALKDQLFEQVSVAEEAFADEDEDG